MSEVDSIYWLCNETLGTGCGMWQYPVWQSVFLPPDADLVMLPMCWYWISDIYRRTVLWHEQNHVLVGKTISPPELTSLNDQSPYGWFTEDNMSSSMGTWLMKRLALSVVCDSSKSDRKSSHHQTSLMLMLSLRHRLQGSVKPLDQLCVGKTPPSEVTLLNW